MYPFKKVLICLETSELDRTLVNFANFIAQNAQSKDIYFMNVIKHLHIPKEVLQEFPQMIDNAIKEREEKMRSFVAEHMGENHDTNIHYIIENGRIATKILKFAEKEKIDLIIIGRREKAAQSGMLAQRLARRASCSLLIVPEGSTPRLEHMLVPSDFSDYSVDAVRKALELAKNTTSKPVITIQNVFSVPTGYHYTGKSYKEFVKVMEKNAEKDFKKFSRHFDFGELKINVEYSLDNNEDPVGDIYEMAGKIKANLIVIGAKGRTAATAFFLGSMAERLIQVDSEFPMLVVRPKGRNAGFWDFIKEI